MKKTDHFQFHLPEHLHVYVEQLKHADTVLPPAIERGLAEGRALALQQVSKRQRLHVVDKTLVFAYPRMMSMFGLFTALLLMMMMLWLGAHKEQDALMLGADMPIEAFVDDGFDAWSAD